MNAQWDELRGLWEASTPGPWTADPDKEAYVWQGERCIATGTVEDSAFIAAAHRDVPLLLAEVTKHGDCVPQDQLAGQLADMRQQEVASSRIYTAVRDERDQLRERVAELEKENLRGAQELTVQMLGNQTFREQTRALLEEREALRAAAQAALSHVLELDEAWRRGALTESDGLGGTRSNRNVVVCVGLTVALARSEAVPS